MENCLDKTCFASFADCAQVLLRDGIVSPECIVDIVPHGAVVFRTIRVIRWASICLATTCPGH